MHGIIYYTDASLQATLAVVYVCFEPENRGSASVGIVGVVDTGRRVVRHTHDERPGPGLSDSSDSG